MSEICCKLLDSSINMLRSSLKKHVSSYTKKMMLGWKLITGIS